LYITKTFAVFFSLLKSRQKKHNKRRNKVKFNRQLRPRQFTLTLTGCAHGAAVPLECFMARSKPEQSNMPRFSSHKPALCALN